MNVIDMHCDTLSVLLQREKRGEKAELGQNDLMVDLKRMRSSGYMLQTFAAFIHAGSVENALESCLELIDLFERQMEKYSDWIRPVRSYREILRNQEQGRMSALLSVEEGGACKGNPAFLRTLYRLGVRMMTLTWNFENELAYPNRSMPEHPHGMTADTENGVKEKGFEILTEMERLGMLIDVSHLSDAGIWDVLHHTSGPVIASHSNARSVCPHCRNLTDDMIRAMAERGGVAGINFCGAFLNADGRSGQPGTVADMAEHIRYLFNVGGEDFVGLGSDFDGIDMAPEIGGCEGLPKLADDLSKAGFTQRQVEKIFFRNVLRVLEDVLK